MTNEEETYLNTRGTFYQLAQVLRLHKMALIAAFLKRHYPGLPFSLQPLPWPQTTIGDHAALQIKVSFPAGRSSEEITQIEQSVYTYLIEVHEGRQSGGVATRRATDALAM
jgi:hypothetical protein